MKLKPGPAKLEIQNVKQEIGIDDVAFAKKLSKKIIKRSQKRLENGNIEITIELDPSIMEVKNE